MRQLFKRARVLLPLLALFAVPAEVFGQVSGRTWSQAKDSIPHLIEADSTFARWSFFQPIDDGILASWNAAAAHDSRWHSNEECQDAMAFTRDAIQHANIQSGLGSASLAGEYFGPLTETSTTNDADVIVIAGLTGIGMDGFSTLIHESWHRSKGWTDLDIDTLNTRMLGDPDIGRAMEDCYDETRNEEEDDDGDDDGGGSDPEPTTTCTDSEEWVPPVTMRVWVKPESTMGESGPPVDLDHEVGAHLPGIVINVESGYWEEVIVSDGYYRTVTTCTTG